MYKCKECNSAHVERKAWVDMNNDEVISECSEDNEPEDHWCRKCEKHVEVYY